MEPKTKLTKFAHGLLMVTGLFALVAVGLFSFGVIDSRGGSPLPEAQQIALEDTPEHTLPFVAEPILRRVPTVTNLQLLDGMVLTGTSNFTPSDFSSESCRVTDIGLAQYEMSLLQTSVATPAGFTEEAFRRYVSDSQLILSNTELVNSPTGPYFEAEVRMVPIGAAYRSAGQPVYLENASVIFTWMMINDGNNTFDPLIRCDTTWA